MGLAIGLVVGTMFGMMVSAIMIDAIQGDLCPRCDSEMIENVCCECGYQNENREG